LTTVSEGKEGNKINAAFDIHNHLQIPALEAQFRNSCCLHFENPYGNTIPNRTQMPQLISEIDELPGMARNSEQQDVVLSIKSLAWRYKVDAHLYIRIIGD
ncbi:MAG: hypothetical protein JXA25_12740, partial [Anaerolineales bacterium]|nr:hypothetical protein [Anaerolineales bacterium]